jgi:hypothetical protein
VDKPNIISDHATQKESIQLESTQIITSEREVEPAENLLAISDNHEKKIAQSNKSVDWIKLLSMNFCMVYPILLILLITILLIIRHRILSHQK